MRLGLVTISLAIIFLQSGCSGGKGASDNNNSNGDLTFNESPTNSQEMVINSIETMADGSEGNVKPSFRAQKTLLACPTSFPTCSNGNTAVSFGGCSESLPGETLEMDGSVAANFFVTGTGVADNMACNSVTQSNAVLPSGDTLNFAINLSTTLTSMASIPALQGMRVLLDTSPGMAWDGTTFPNAATGISIKNDSGTRTMTVYARHEEVVAPNGTVWADYAVSGQMTVSGTLLTSTRAIQNGSAMTVWNNTRAYKAITTAGNDDIGNPIKWGSSTCCHPTSGKLTSVFTGSQTGTSSITFTSSCGTANYKDINGGTGTLSMDSCN